jgi:hypothetical protein
MAEATKTATKSPNGEAALRGGPVAERVGKLREQAREDPAGAREEAWAWIEELGKRAKSDRAGALEELQELFVCGQPAERVDGQTEGILVTWTMHPIADKVIGTITDAWMPWLGKKFDPAERRGINTLTDSARWPAKILWPLYSTREAELGRSAFNFTTYVEAGKLDPEVDVLVIDYESVSENPNLLIRQIRDELVQIVPGANLGKMLVKVPRRAKLFPALYFALKSEI